MTTAENTHNDRVRTDAQAQEVNITALSEFLR